MLDRNVEYKEYTLRVSHLCTTVNPPYISTYQVNCPELNFCVNYDRDANSNKDTELDNIIAKFKKEVDSRTKDTDKILHTYHQHLKSLSYRAHSMTTNKLKEELRDIYELFGDLLGFSEQDIRREYFEATSTKE